MAAVRPKRISQQSILIWVDADIDSNDPDIKQILDQLHEIVSSVEMAKTLERCIEILKDAEPTKCYLILSGALGEDFVPHIHSSSHLEAIFVFCGKRSYHESWMKRWSKIQGVFTFID